MFLPNDLYTTLGNSKLFHCWTDKVTKFDSSSFYNWEQDNMPVYDLEERTHFLWEHLGYPLSSIPGVAYVVSADAPQSAVACNKNIFRTVSAAVEALPKVINYPIIIEVANFGNLGDLVLDNYDFGPRGSLEIINRNFAKGEGTLSSTTNPVGQNSPFAGSLDSYFGGSFNGFDYVSSIVKIGTYNSSLSGNNHEVVDATLKGGKTSPMKSFLEASCMSISAAVFSSTQDSRLSSTINLNGYVSQVKWKNNYSKSTLIVSEKNGINPYTGNEYEIKFAAYDKNPNSSDGISSKDTSTLDIFNNTAINFTHEWTTNTGSPVGYNSLMYGNFINKIVINNCNGPVYIRNFFLDGSGSNSSNNNHGFTVNNCNNLFIENCVATRYRKAGFYFNNSNVNLLRGCVATRIYDFNSSGQRITGDYEIRRNTLTSNYASGHLAEDDSAGIVANNSVITVSSTEAIEYSQMKSILGSAWDVFIPMYCIFEFTKNSNGIILNNSTLKGGKSRDSRVPYTHYQMFLDIAHNVGAGIVCNNSKVSFDGSLRLIENLRGIKLVNSTWEIDKAVAVGNQKEAILSDRSTITYNKNLDTQHIGGATNDTNIGSMYFKNNGQHMLLDNSKFVPLYASGMPTYYTRMLFKDTIGKPMYNTSSVEGFLEAVKISNNSKATFICAEVGRGSTYASFEGNRRAVKGSEFCVINNSQLDLIGTKHFATKVYGPNEYNSTQKLAGVYAGNNSVVNIHGPTVIAQYGVDCLAESHSTINISPPRDKEDSSYSYSEMNLLDDQGNHTMVELHAVNSCLVANNKSIINMVDLGSWRNTWSANVDYDDTTDTLDYETESTVAPSATLAGRLQFYPNPTPSGGDDYTGNINGADNLQSTLNGAESFTPGSLGYYFLKDLTSPTLSFSTVTWGGYCLRAVNDSTVNVKNVNFPCAFWDSSNVFYDGTVGLDGGGYCTRTFIWNIADSSKLNASYLSVSSLFPRRAGYRGPYGYWRNSFGSLFSGAPISTPDTSTVSVLDFFGENPSGTAYSVSSAQNYGPFRLYFSVNPLANFLDELTTSSPGIYQQLYAQGYQPSSNLRLTKLINPSSIGYQPFMQSLQRNSAGVIDSSGYYYAKDMMFNPYEIRVILDESASDTFANAKHCSIGKSNIPKVVGIYSNRTEVGYGDMASIRGIPSVNIFDLERNN